MGGKHDSSNLPKGEHQGLIRNQVRSRSGWQGELQIHPYQQWIGHRGYQMRNHQYEPVLQGNNGWRRIDETQTDSCM